MHRRSTLVYMGEPQSRSGQHPATFALEGRHAVAQAAALRFEPPIITDAEREVVEELAARVGRRTCVPHQPGNAFSKPISTMLDPLHLNQNQVPSSGKSSRARETIRRETIRREIIPRSGNHPAGNHPARGKPSGGIPSSTK